MKSLVFYITVILSLVFIGCSPANVQIILSSRSTLTEITTNEKINSDNQTTFAVEGLCKDKSEMVELTITDSTGVESSVMVNCLNEKFVTQVDLSSMQDGDVLVELKSQAGTKNTKTLKKNTVAPEVVVEAPSSTYMHKNSEIVYRLNVSKSDFEFDSQKIKLQGQIEGCTFNVTRPLFSSAVIEVVVRNCVSEGQISLQLEPGFVKDNFGNKNPIKTNQQPVQLRNNTVKLIWGLPSKKVINSALVSQIPFKVEGYEVGSNGITNFPDISSRLESKNGLAGCALTQSGSFPDYFLSLSNCTSTVNSVVQFRLPANEFTNSAGLKNEIGAWSPEVLVDNLKPNIVVTEPASLIGSAGTVFSFKIDYPSTDLFLMTPSYVVLTGNSDNCAKTITENNGNKYLNVFGCSVNSGSVGIKILGGAIKDEAGNLSDEWIFSNALTVNNTGPIVSIGSPNFSAINISRTLDIPVTFTNATSIQLTNSKVELAMSVGVSGCAVSVVSDANPNIRHIQVSGCAGDGTVSIKILAGAALASAGVQSVEVSSPSVIKVDNTAPSVVSYSDDGQAIKKASFRSQIEFSENIANISTNSAQTNSGVVSDYIGNQKTSSFNVSPTFLTSSLTLSIAANSYQDDAGNYLPAYSKVIQTHTKPSVILSSLAPDVKVRGRFQVLLTADQSIIPPIPSNFTVQGAYISSIVGALGSYVIYLEPQNGVSSIELKLVGEQLKSAVSDLGSQASNVLTWSYEQAVGVSFEKSDLEIAEGNTAGESRILKILLDRARGQETLLNLKVLRETSTANLSSISLDDQLITVPSGVTEFLVSFTVNGDTATNSENKYLDVVLSSADPIVLFKTAAARIKILDDEKSFKYSQIALGVNHGCAITTNQKLKCWGQNDFGKLGIGVAGSIYSSPKEVDSTSNYVKVSAGGNHTCGLLSSGSVKCWGSNSRGQLGISTVVTSSLLPESVISGSTYLDVGVGVSHSCALRADRRVECWGDNSAGQLGDGTTTSRSYPSLISGSIQFQKIAVGGSHVCGLGLDNRIYCWGANGSKQISVNTGSIYTPALIDSSNLYIDVSASATSTCGLTSANEVICYGAINGSVNGSIIPSKNYGGSFEKVVVGGNHLCGIQSDQIVKCLGSNSSGQIGVGTFSTPVTFTSVPKLKLSSLSLGYESSCGINESNDLLCWGLNTLGQLGLGYLSFKATPSTLTSALQFHSIASGLLTQSQCAIDSSSKLRCWGYNYFDQLGVSKATIESNLRIVAAEKSFIKVSSSELYTCGITNINKLYCWGNSASGRLGDGADVSTSMPSIVDAASDYIDIELGRDHACAITINKELKCWGLNDKLQLGLPASLTQTNLPKVIDSGVQYLQVSSGFRHTCALGIDKKIKCWGLNDNGQLGNGQSGTDLYNEPSYIQSAILFNKVKAGYKHTCAISESNKMYCWGINAVGQLGIGSTTNSVNPIVVDSSESYVDLSLNSNHTCGLTTSGKLKCWGLNNWGQLGEGTQVTSTLPVFVSDSEVYSKVSLGAFHTCAITSTTNKLRCWGRNDAGQLGLQTPPVIRPNFVR